MKAKPSYLKLSLIASLILSITLARAEQEGDFTEASSLTYGMYVHFGVQTFAKLDEKGTIPAGRFAPPALDVKKWAHAAKEAGMTFAVLNIKHVNGFCLWDSKDYDYDIAQSSFKGDLIADFIAACNAEGIVPGSSYLITDVRQEGSYRAKEPVLPVHFAVIKKQIAELHTRYPELRLQIFEHSPRLSTAQWDELNGTVQKLNPQCLILDAFREPRYVPAAVVKGNGWFWSPKAVITPAAQLLQSWQQCQAEKKALILSVGPDTSGRIPNNQLAVLTEMKTLMASSAAKPVSTPAAETKPDATKRLKEVKALSLEPTQLIGKTFDQCLGKGMAEYSALLGEPVVNDSKQKGYVRLIHTYKTDEISSLSVHQLPEYSVPVWITITFKDTPKTWQEAFKIAGLSTEGITAKMHSTGGAVLEGFKSVDGKLWAVEFDPTKEQLNAPCHIEIQPKNMDDYKK